MTTSSSISRKLISASLAAAAAILTIAAAGCGGGGGGTSQFSTPTYPFSFSYPSGWKVTRNASFTYGSGSGERSLSVALKEPYDQVTITQYKLLKTLPTGTNGNQREVDRVVAKLTTQAKGTASDGKAVAYGGIPGYQYTVEYSAANGTLLRDTLTFLFKGRNEFLLNCQSTPKNRTELEKGCNQILGSLKFN